MTRIIAGSHKGRRLKAPKGLDVRPTGARVKQTLFDILAPRQLADDRGDGLQRGRVAGGGVE